MRGATEDLLPHETAVAALPFTPAVGGRGDGFGIVVQHRSPAGWILLSGLLHLAVLVALAALDRARTFTPVEVPSDAIEITFEETPPATAPAPAVLPSPPEAREPDTAPPSPEPVAQPAPVPMPDPPPAEQRPADPAPMPAEPAPEPSAVAAPPEPLATPPPAEPTASPAEPAPTPMAALPQEAVAAPEPPPPPPPDAPPPAPQPEPMPPQTSVAALERQAPPQPPPPAPIPVAEAPPQPAPPLPVARNDQRERAEAERRRRTAEDARQRAQRDAEAERARLERQRRETQRQAPTAPLRTTRVAPSAPAGPPVEHLIPAPAAQAPTISPGAYRGSVIAKIAAVQRYPDAARSRGEQGTPTVAFSIDASGHVTSVSIAHSSGSAAIDAELMAMVRRAAPFPVPPPGAARSMTATIGFRLH